MIKNSRMVTLFLLVTMFGNVIPSTAFSASPKPSPSATKKTTTSTNKPATTASKKPTVTSAKKNTQGSTYFGYKGRPDASDTDIPPVLTQLSGSALGDGGVEFRLPEIASAKNVLGLIIADLAEAGIRCEISDPNINPLIPSLPGNVKNDTLASCTYGEPLKDGFVMYVITEKSAVQTFNTPQNILNYLKFASPIKGNGEQTQFTPSNRAILFTVGGQYAFDANEIAWGALYNLRFVPPNRNA